MADNRISNFEPVYRNPTKQEDVAFCTKCKCTWFEQVMVKQFKSNHSTIIGQMVPPAGEFEFVVIRCIKCGEKHQPNVLVTSQDRTTKLYNDFLDQIEKEEPKAEPEEKK